jgi:hypothetical protein
MENGSAIITSQPEVSESADAPGWLANCLRRWRAV